MACYSGPYLACPSFLARHLIGHQKKLKDTSLVSLAAAIGLVIVEGALALAGRTFSSDLLAFSFGLVRHFYRECNETNANCMVRVREMERRRSV